MTGATSTPPSEDALFLASLGHTQTLPRSFSLTSLLGLSFAILNTWTALAASLSLALPSGGPSAIIWGLLLAGLCNLCLAASLAEFLSAWPTAGGQYHWTAMICWPRYSRGISYITGWINVAGWAALSCAGPLLGSGFVVGAMALFDETYQAQAWHQFLLYLAFIVVALGVNVFLARVLPLVNKAALVWSIVGFLVVSVAVVACKAGPGGGEYQSARFVYGGFANETGWPDGLAWLLGLLQGGFSLTGFDAVAHMIEEIPRPHVQGPRIMLYCIGIGMATGFVFLSCLLFVVKDVNQVISSPAGPLLQIFMDATNSQAGSTCLLIFPLMCMLFASLAILSTSSRMSYAFARDRGMPLSSVFAKIHPTLNVPVNALLWTTGWVVLFGLILLGSTSALSAIISASVVALGVTYAIPPTIHVLRGRNMLPENRRFRLGGWFGWALNLIGIAWTVLTTVLFLFPPGTPVTSGNMNYCIVAFGVILLVSVGTWVLDGRRNYKGPCPAVEGLRVDSVEGDEAKIDSRMGSNEK